MKRTIKERSLRSIELVPFKKLILLAIISNIIIMLLVLLFSNNLPPQVPLFYGLARGENQLASRLGLLIPSLVSLSIISFNLIVSFFVKSIFLKKTLIIASVAATVFSLITTVKIFFLIASF
jgi:hypothetical protein